MPSLLLVPLVALELNAMNLSLQALIRSDVPAVAVFGKSSGFQAEKILKVARDENRRWFDTVRYLRRYFDTVVFDAEHFFDSYRMTQNMH